MTTVELFAAILTSKFQIDFPIRWSDVFIHMMVRCIYQSDGHGEWGKKRRLE